MLRPPRYPQDTLPPIPVTRPPTKIELAPPPSLPAPAALLNTVFGSFHLRLSLEVAARVEEAGREAPGRGDKRGDNEEGGERHAAPAVRVAPCAHLNDAWVDIRHGKLFRAFSRPNEPRRLPRSDSLPCPPPSALLPSALLPSGLSSPTAPPPPPPPRRRRRT